MYKAIILAAILFPYGTYAGNGGKGKVNVIEFNANGVILFRHSGMRSNAPQCAGKNFQNRWAIDAKTDAGKAQLSGLLTAYSAGKNLTIVGTGNCSLWGDTETVHYFYMHD